MAAQPFGFFIAGFETSSSTISYCLYELAQHPDIQSRVREKIETVLQNVEGGGITCDALAQMSILERVLPGQATMNQLNISLPKDYKMHQINPHMHIA
ncbi:probable cytochrome P450 6a14 [Drosophila pseudoobscura]|uniref:Probable cytochrome P450 6a14 n=1 Tax=Drosophila pseudoobscura pseudoobscura TaxID=46245 RepID=A0A6I8W2U9_DROPS|nr:probable cytochrome P450 6a14 [Drosophila pseudoobscura]